MTNITIAIPDDRLHRLKEIAARLQVTLEDLLRVSLEELLTRPDDAFQNVARHVLEKNAELYRRLA